MVQHVFGYVRWLRFFRNMMRHNFTTVLVWAVFLNLIFGVLFYWAEAGAQELSFLDALWWAMVTMTTVGYGDFYAQTVIGRFIISYPCMIIGIGLIGYLVGTVANSLIDLAEKKRRGRMHITEKNHVIFCNYPGEEKILSIIGELEAVRSYERKAYVLITEKLDLLPEALSKKGVKFVHGSPTNEDTLMQANILECNGVFILAQDSQRIESDERTFTVSALIEMIEKEHGRSIKTIAELVSEKSFRTIKRADVDGTTSEDGMASCLLVQEYINPGINVIISQLLSNKEGSQLYISSTTCSGIQIRELQIEALQHETDIQIIGMIRNEQNILNPSSDTVLQEGDRLIVLANNSSDVKAVENIVKEKVRNKVTTS